jgi:N-acetylmuramoyl-L-alanine amidase CwlA
MANLDKLLRKIEKNKETENETKTYPLEIAGETFDVRTMTRKEKQDFIYAQDANSANMTAGDLIKKMKPFIYKSLDLAQLATRAKEDGYIKSYYDVVEALFEPNELLEIINFIIEINNITGEDVKGDIEEIKK